MERVYETHLLRRSFREDGKVRNVTVANLSHVPAETIDVMRKSLAGKTLVEAGAEVTIARSVPHGHVAAVWAIAQKLGLPTLLGPACRMRDLALALVISRAVAPASNWPPSPPGTTSPWVRTWPSRGRPPMRCTRRWIIC